MNRKESFTERDWDRTEHQNPETRLEEIRRGRGCETKRIVEIDGENLPGAMKLFMRVYSEP